MTLPDAEHGTADSSPPRTPTETAKYLWDTAIQYLEAAANETDVPTSDAYVRIGELSLKAAQFALANPALLVGVSDDDPQALLPPGAPPLPTSITGAPTPPIWGGSR